LNVNLNSSVLKEKIPKFSKQRVNEDKLKRYELLQGRFLKKIYTKKQLIELTIKKKKEKLEKTKIYFRKKYKQRRNKFVPLLL